MYSGRRVAGRVLSSSPSGNQDIIRHHAKTVVVHKDGTAQAASKQKNLLGQGDDDDGGDGDGESNEDGGDGDGDGGGTYVDPCIRIGMCGCSQQISRLVDGNFCEQLCGEPTDERYVAAGMSPGNCVDAGFTVNSGLIHFGMYEEESSGSDKAAGELGVATTGSCNPHYLERAANDQHGGFCEDFCVSSDHEAFADARSDVQKGTCDVTPDIKYTKYVGKGTIQIWTKDGGGLTSGR